MKKISFGIICVLIGGVIGIKLAQHHIQAAAEAQIEEEYFYEN
jgi:hypothetical protein